MVMQYLCRARIFFTHETYIDYTNVVAKYEKVFVLMSLVHTCNCSFVVFFVIDVDF